jgi:hypothetical protein
MLDIQVTSRREEAENIISLELRAKDGALLPAFTAGSPSTWYCPTACCVSIARQRPGRAASLPNRHFARARRAAGPARSAQTRLRVWSGGVHRARVRYGSGTRLG